MDQSLLLDHPHTNQKKDQKDHNDHHHLQEADTGAKSLETKREAEARLQATEQRDVRSYGGGRGGGGGEGDLPRADADAEPLSRDQDGEEEEGEEERGERELYEREMALAAEAAEMAAEAAAAAARLRETNPAGDIEFKAIPADPMTVAETLVKVRGEDW